MRCSFRLIFGHEKKFSRKFVSFFQRVIVPGGPNIQKGVRPMPLVSYASGHEPQILATAAYRQRLLNLPKTRVRSRYRSVTDNYWTLFIVSSLRLNVYPHDST